MSSDIVGTGPYLVTWTDKNFAIGSPSAVLATPGDGETQRNAVLRTLGVMGIGRRDLSFVDQATKDRFDALLDAAD